MRVKTLKVSGIDPWESDFELDLTNVTGVIAVSGKNGSGKTRLFELLGPATLYRHLPTRDSRSLESLFKPDGEVQLRVEVSGEDYEFTIRRKTSDFLATVRKIGSKAPPTSGKLGEYDDAIEKLLGPKEAFYASVYGAQGGVGGLRGLKVAERKAVITYYLGLNRAIELHDRFKELRKTSSASAEIAASALADIKATEVLQKESAKTIAEADAALDRAKAELAEVTARCEGLGDLLQQQREMKAWKESERRRVDAIESAHRRVADIKERLKTYKSNLASMQGEQDEIIAPELPENYYEDDLSELQRKLRRREAAEQQKESITERASSARSTSSLIDKVPCKGEGEYEACPLLANANEAKNKIPVLRLEWKAVTEELRGLPEREALQELQGKVRSLREEWSAYRREVQGANEAQRQQAVLTTRIEAAQEELKEAQAALERFEAVKPSPKPPEAADADEEASRRLLGRRDVLQEEVERLGRLKHTEEGKVSTRQELLDRAGKRYEENRSAHEDVDAYDLLIKGMGANGLRALEMDVAGPDLTEKANKILEGCLGGRFSIVFRTTKEIAKGKGVAEDFNVEVYDSLKPDVVRTLGDLSGGEGVIVDEAIRTALAIFANDRTDTPFKTLWRDELGAALDEDNTQDYPEMLRSARVEGRFEQVFFVSHNKQVREAADWVIELSSSGAKLRKPVH